MCTCVKTNVIDLTEIPCNVSKLLTEIILQFSVGIVGYQSFELLLPVKATSVFFFLFFDVNVSIICLTT